MDSRRPVCNEIISWGAGAGGGSLEIETLAKVKTKGLAGSDSFWGSRRRAEQKNDVVRRAEEGQSKKGQM